MGFSEDQLLNWFAQYAYQPYTVYAAIITLMFLSSFGFPAPEEITLIATGIVCYMGSRPDLYPPPFVGAPVVDAYVAATVAFFAVFLSDFLVFMLGRKFGVKILRTKYLSKYADKMDKVSQWTTKYGKWAAGVFRFTPGLRFPGHFACGMIGLSPTTFTLIDGTAVLLSVPTQVLLVSHYGETILGNIKQFKIYIFSALGIIILGWMLFRWYQNFKSKKVEAS